VSFVFKTLLPRVWRRSRQQELTGRSAQIAYFLLFASLPALLVVVGILSKVSIWDFSDPMASLLAMGLPPEIAQPLTDEVKKVADPASSRIFLGSLLGFYLAARAIDAICKGVNAAWGLRDSRPWTHRKVRVLAITIASVAGVALTLILLSIEPALRAWVAKEGGVIGSARIAWLRYPILLFVLHSLIWLVYRLGAERRVGHGWITWGSLGASLGIVAFSFVFHFYVQNVVDLGATYGSLGSAIGLAAFCYFSAYMVLLGAALDCELKQLGY
jgi:membrane protein